MPHGKGAADYLTDVIAAKAAGFIRGSAAAGQPFFLYLAVYAPHKPATPAPRHAEPVRRPQGAAHRRPSTRPTCADKPATIRKLPRLSPSRRWRRSTRSTAAGRSRCRRWTRRWRRWSQALTASGQLDNTYIFFTSDNGFHMGQHRLKPGKYTPYETDVHVPLLVRGPGIAAGSATSAATSSVDFVADDRRAGGGGAPFPGRRPLVRARCCTARRPADWRQVMLLEQFEFVPENDAPDERAGAPRSPGRERRPPIPSHLGVRTPRLKYVEYGTGEREVYDLRRDPDELNNLAAAQRSRLAGADVEPGPRSRRLRGDACREMEAQAVPAP